MMLSKTSLGLLIPYSVHETNPYFRSMFSGLLEPMFWVVTRPGCSCCRGCSHCSDACRTLEACLYRWTRSESPFVGSVVRQSGIRSSLLLYNPYFSDMELKSAPFHQLVCHELGIWYCRLLTCWMTAQAKAFTPSRYITILFV